ncbi:MAG: GGDEF domain-containing protein [Desulfonatronovibrionaceae bacterium]
MPKKDTIFWLLDLPETYVTEIQENIPGDCRLQRATGLQEIHQEADDPLRASIVFITPEKWDRLSTEEREILSGQYLHQVLIIDTGQKLSETDINEMGSFLGILRRPVTRVSLQKLLNKAVEIQELYSDLHFMAREISLERELLARKNAQLEFLNRILTKSSSSLKVEDILNTAHQEFSELISTQGLGAVFWKYSENREITAELYMPALKNNGLKKHWLENLLGIVRRFTGQEVSGYKEFKAYAGMEHELQAVNFLPVPVQQVVVPLQNGKKYFGALVVISGQPLRLGRDQLQIINSAGNHLALTLRNALKYRSLREEADIDGLTNVFNRQHFDKQLRVELKRHQRHAKSLSLVMLDLDYFKKLNDRYGHQAGDMVLKKTGRLLEETVRETDFPARYGGEEFVVILPETTEEQAWLLAERIRRKISRTKFSYQGQNFNVTASIGVASMLPGPLTPGDSLINKADQALYMAKNSGKNMVCSSADMGVGEAVTN